MESSASAASWIVTEKKNKYNVLLSLKFSVFVSFCFTDLNTQKIEDGLHTEVQICLHDCFHDLYISVVLPKLAYFVSGYVLLRYSPNSELFSFFVIKLWFLYSVNNTVFRKVEKNARQRENLFAYLCAFVAVPSIRYYRNNLWIITLSFQHLKSFTFQGKQPGLSTLNKTFKAFFSLQKLFSLSKEMRKETNCS